MEGGSGLMRPVIAAGKAWGALDMGLWTRNLAGRAQSLPQFFGALAALADGRVLPVPGGVPVRDQGQRVIGAVGASGDTADNDEAAALAGIAAVSGLIAESCARRSTPPWSPIVSWSTDTNSWPARPTSNLSVRPKLRRTCSAIVCLRSHSGIR